MAQIFSDKRYLQVGDNMVIITQPTSDYRRDGLPFYRSVNGVPGTDFDVLAAGWCALNFSVNTTNPDATTFVEHRGQKVALVPGGLYSSITPENGEEEYILITEIKGRFQDRAVLHVIIQV